MFKKILCLVLITSTLIFNTSIVYADIEDEIIDINENEEIIQASNNINDEPILNSRIAVAYDRKTGTVIWGKNENKRSAMASTTKIMSALLLIENADLSQEVVISQKAGGTGGSRLGLKKGDKITLNDLLYGLMLKSGNDAAVAIAETVGGDLDNFAEMMNNKAHEIGLENTHFVTPHGLDNPEHYTTAYELAKLADYAMKNEIFAQVVNTKNYTVTINGYPKNISNTNELLGNLEGVNGVKTGFTNNAGRCLVTCTNRNGFETITVVLGADTKKFRTQDSIKLIEYTYKNFKEIDITETITSKFLEWKRINQNKIIIEKAKKNSRLELIFNDIKNNCIPIKTTDLDKIEIEIYCLTYLKAPIKENSILGNMKIMLNGEVIEMVDIINKEKIEKKNEIDYFLEFLDLIA